VWEDAEADKRGADAAPPDPPEQSADDKTGGKEGGDEGKDKTGGEDFAAQLKALNDKLTGLEKKNHELAESERYWAEQARAGGRREETPEEPEDDDDDPGIEGDTADKQVEEFSTDGVAALVKRGLLTKKDAREIARKEAERVAKQVVGKAQKQYTADAELATEFPELSDESSELFQATKKIYREMVAQDDTLKRSPMGLTMAARLAKSQLQPAKPADNGGEPGPSRDDRIRKQGERGRSRGAAFQGEDEDRLSPRQKGILAKFNADGGPQVTEEEYTRRAKEGVRMSSGNAYRSGSMDWGAD
jgi:hypothetical protein